MKDLCLTCKHHWVHFSTSAKDTISHCDVADEKHGFSCKDEIVIFPYTKCPFNSYEQK